jgi:membrane protein required for colicin V production
MQDFSTFDIVVIAITILLGLKGLFRGFIKEVFGLIGIVGGVFVASRFAADVGELIAPVLALEKSSSIELMGFIVGLIVFWIIAYILGLILTKIFSLSGLGIFDKILGFLFGAFKVFLILSIIIYALSQVNAIKEKLDETIGDTMTYPILVSGGSFIIQLDKEEFTKEMKNSVDNAVEKTKETVNELSQKEVEKQLNELKQEGLDKANEMLENKSEVNETMTTQPTQEEQTIKQEETKE